MRLALTSSFSLSFFLFLFLSLFLPPSLALFALYQHVSIYLSILHTLLIFRNVAPKCVTSMPVVPLMMQKDYNAKGWLGLLLGEWPPPGPSIDLLRI